MVVAGVPARVIKKKDEKSIRKTELVDALRELGSNRGIAELRASFSTCWDRILSRFCSSTSGIQKILCLIIAGFRAFITSSILRYR